MYELKELFDLYEQERIVSSRLKVDDCEEILSKRKVIIYGAGNVGTVLHERLRSLGVDIFAFWDDNGSIFGSEYKNTTIVNSKTINGLIDDELYVVIVALFDIMSYDKIKNQVIQNWGGDRENLLVLYFTQLRDFTELFSLDKRPSFSAYLGENPKDLYLHKNDILDVYDLLKDNESKQVYRELFNFYIYEDFVNFTVHPFEEHFFDYTIYNKIPDEVFVDCGAFCGDTLSIFLDNNLNYKKYIAIEADKQNYSELQRMVDYHNTLKIIALNEYISNEKKYIGFESDGTSYSHSSEDRNNVISTTTLDDLVYKYSPTFIKINIEGADLDAIRGASRIIHDFHPIVACQGHHKMEHLWEIVRSIELYGSGQYAYYLRNYRGITEFTFYAIPLVRIR